ncbi:MAG: thiol oxidoreductase [Acidimicrobiales bacterium]|nr:MAG: thiol oxidoreductase [Acidimicrobiales bacterium]
MRRLGLLVLVAGLGAVLLACGSTAEAGLDAALGGTTTREATGRNAFSLPAPGISNEERRTFEVGDSFFTQNWVSAPASTDARDGLGPRFNAQACSSCHTLDGRGAPPDPNDDVAELGLLFRLSVPGADPVTGAPLPDPVYGGQLQDRSILGVTAEGSMGISYTERTGSFADGTTYVLREPIYTIEDAAFGEPSAEIMIGPRLAPQVIGMGLLEAIPQADIEANADPEDADGDGISGRPNTVWSRRAGEPTLGRFGWKANVASVEEQVAGAFLGDIGITSSLNPTELCGSDPACLAAPTGGMPELTDDRLASVTLYQQTLAVPAMRDVDDPEVQRGAALFESSGCQSCHVADHTTGPSPIETLDNQRIHPYTDLLLHDMGEGLADGRPDFDATGAEWRTPPLWGIGLIDDVNGHRFLLHDGRARTIEEAILWHGGEAEASADTYRSLDVADRAALLTFLEAL